MSLFPDQQELKLIVYVLAWVFVSILVFESLRKKGLMDSYSARKWVHVSIFLPIFLAYYLVDRPLYPLLLTGGALLFTYLTAPVSPIPKLRLRIFSEGHPWGTTLFSLSVFLIILFFFSYPVPGIVAGSALALGDGFSGLVGKRYGKLRPSFLKGKSVEGSLSFFVATVAGSFLSIWGLDLMNSTDSVVVLILLGSLVGMVVEVFSAGGLDNITVPTSSGLVSFFALFLF